jgi:hypothetical protein
LHDFIGGKAWPCLGSSSAYGQLGNRSCCSNPSSFQCSLLYAIPRSGVGQQRAVCWLVSNLLVSPLLKLCDCTVVDAVEVSVAKERQQVAFYG